MNKIILILTTIFFLSGCSFNENSSIWKDKNNQLDDNKNIKKIYPQEQKILSELNKGLILDLSLIKKNNKIYDNKNNLGSIIYNGELNKVGKYKFSKFEEINKLDFKPGFLESGIIFFDKKGSVIRYNNNNKVLWKKNYYLKSEKKLKPKLNFLLDKKIFL